MAKNDDRCSRNHLLIKPNLKQSDLERGRKSCLACDRARAYAKTHKKYRDYVLQIAHRNYRQIMKPQDSATN